MARKYRRDARGRFAGGGFSGQSGGRGARLKASGTRSGGGAKMRGERAGGTVAKPRGLKPQAVKATQRKPGARLDGDAFAARAKRARGTSLRRGISESDRENALSSSQRRAAPPAKRFAAANQRQARADRTAAAARAFYDSYGSPSTFGRRPRQSTASSPSFGSKSRSRRRR